MEEAQPQQGVRGRRGNARDAKRSARAALAGHVGPVHHAQDPGVRGAGRGRPRAHRAQCRHDPRGNRDRVPRGRRGARGLEEGRRRRAGRARAHAAGPVPAADPGERAARVHPARAQSRAQRADRRPAHGLRAGLRLALHLQPGRGAPLRQHRGLPQLREARLPVEIAAPLRRHDLRARRPAGQQAALRHGLQPHEVQRQVLHGIRDPPRAGEGHGRDGEDPVRRRLARPGDRQAEDLHRQPHQRELADDLRRDDARRAQGLRARQPGLHRHALHPRGRHVAGDGRRHGDADARRGTGRHGVHAAAQSRLPDGARQLRLLAVDAVRRADLRHARARARALHHGEPRAAARRAVPLGREPLRRRRSRMRRRPSSRRRRCCRPASAA